MRNLANDCRNMRCKQYYAISLTWDVFLSMCHLHNMIIASDFLFPSEHNISQSIQMCSSYCSTTFNISSSTESTGTVDSTFNSCNMPTKINVLTSNRDNLSEPFIPNSCQKQFLDGRIFPRFVSRLPPKGAMPEDTVTP